MNLLPSYTDCFFCGPHGDGLKMRIQVKDGTIFSDFALDPKFQGYDNLAHGGIVSGILDEVMWWTIFVLTGKITVTRKMETEFLMPVRCGAPYKVTAKLLQQRHGNMYISGVIEDGEGKTVTRANALFRTAKHTTPGELAAKLDFSHTSHEMRDKLLSALSAQGKDKEG
ncbi:MAG TPA: PaaI family thioesterase [Syntrophorhabdales bacterium]|nr:PaaI family thioesterase [Syntrophorhabdales bacterium]